VLHSKFWVFKWQPIKVLIFDILKLYIDINILGEEIVFQGQKLKGFFRHVKVLDNQYPTLTSGLKHNNSYWMACNKILKYFIKIWFFFQFHNDTKTTFDICSRTKLWSTFYDLTKSYKLEQRISRGVPTGAPESKTSEAEPL